MSRVARAVLAVALVAWGAPAAATEIGFTGALEFHLTTLDPLVATGVGVAEASTVAGSITRLDVPAHVFTTNGYTVPVTDPSAAPIKGLYADHLGNETGVFVRDGNGDVGGSMPLHGAIKVCLFGPCSNAVANVTVPASAIGHDATGVASAAVNLTVRGAPWTVNTVDAQPDPVAGSEAPGQLNLVTPVMVSTNIGASAVVMPYGRISFSFGPSGTDNCANDYDDDHDGFADFPDDPGCSSADDPSERADGAGCDDGVDNDGDFRIDVADPGCDGPLDPSEHSVAIACDDGVDNDGDGLADVADPGCVGPGDASEHGAIACDDGLDTDGDGLTDLQDPGCVDAFDQSERGSGVPCDDGIDDDDDGATDFPDDAGCASIQDPSEHSAAFVCDDGVDNDGDGRSDYAQSGGGDPGCSSTADASEKSQLLVCDDGLDNDFDGRSDVPLDPGCSSPGDPSEQAVALACDNGLDDDGDGSIDSQQDGGCTAPDDPRESVDLADGAFHVLFAGNSPGDGLYLSDDPTIGPSSLYLSVGGVIAGDLEVAGGSFVRAAGGTIEGSLVASEDADVEIRSATLLGQLEARDGATITILGTGFDLPLGAVGATVGTLAGFLADGTPFVWDFARDSGAAIILAPEPDASSLAVLAVAVVIGLRRRRR